MGQAGIYVGIDVAKAKVDVAVRPTGERWEVPAAQQESRSWLPS